jgi:glucosamine-6-phosphate deaminase
MIPGTVVDDGQLAMPIEELKRASKLPLVIHRDKPTLYEWLARYMADEIRAANQAGRPLRWILPVGPKAHYPRLAELTNQEGLSWKQVWCFHMDEFCDWEGRWIPADSPYSFRGYAQRELYDRIRPELRNPPDQVIFPDPSRIDDYSGAITEVGGVDTAYGGFGYRGHVGFNETPETRWTRVGLDELRRGRTRVVQLADDTMVALSHRTAGGNSFAVPPMAVTVGMHDILAARKLHLVTDGGAWKQFILRVLLLGDADIRFPVTLCQEHPDCTVSCDEESARPVVASE